jgi:hypothetical protein
MELAMQAFPPIILEGCLLKATRKHKWHKCWCVLTLTTLSVGKHQVDHPLMFHDEKGKDGMQVLVVVTRERDFVLRCSDKSDLEAWMTGLRRWQYPKPHPIPLKRITPHLDPITYRHHIQPTPSTTLVDYQPVVTLYTQS